MRSHFFACNRHIHLGHSHFGPPHFIARPISASSGEASDPGAQAGAQAGYAGGSCRGPRFRSSPEIAWEARGEEGGFGSGAFGVRRPLRFLAVKLGLNEHQVKELARIIDELKTERAQSEVDRRRSLAGFADAVASAEFDEKRAGDSADLRIADAERLRTAVLAALKQIHALLDDTQREQLAYLIRTGTLLL